ncbi:MAG: hypothetical protein M5U26_07610 [Planctomycetota bacterium]|nr:hypothetical protein [Planctomycetota bacterium]
MAPPRKPKNGKDDDSKTSNVNWRGRQQRDRIFGTLKLLLLVVVLGALTGVGIVYKDKILGLFGSQQQTTKAPPPAPKPEPKAAPAPEVKEEPKKAEPAPAPEVAKPAAPAPTPEPKWDEAESKKAQALIEQGRERLAKLTQVSRGGLEWQEFDFDGGKKLFEEAAQLKAAPEVHGAAQAWARKAGEFKLATSHIDITEFATVPATYVLSLVNGNTIRGLKVEETNEYFKLQRIPEDNPATLGKMKVPIGKSDIQQVKEVPLTERQAEFRQLLAQLESGLDLNSNDPRDLYDIVYLAKRLALGPELVEYLDKAFSKSPEGRLGDTFRKLVVDRALERSALLAAAGRRPFAEDELRRLLKTLPEYQVAQDEVEAFRIQVLDKIKKDFKSTITLAQKAESPKTPATPAKQEEPKKSAKELAAEAAGMGGGEEIVVDSSALTAGGKSAAKLAEANKCFDEGMKYYKQFRQGTTGKNNQMLEKAGELLDRAVDLYGEILDQEPNNKGVESRQTEANMISYACKKYHTLDMAR